MDSLANQKPEHFARHNEANKRLIAKRKHLLMPLAAPPAGQWMCPLIWTRAIFCWKKVKTSSSILPDIYPFIQGHKHMLYTKDDVKQRRRGQKKKPKQTKPCFLSTPKQ